MTKSQSAHDTATAQRSAPGALHRMARSSFG